MANSSLENLRSTIEELTLDIGRILHANTSTLLMVNQTLTSTIETLAAKGVAVADVDPFEVEEQAGALANQVGNALERLCDTGTESGRSEALTDADWATLRQQVELFRNFETTINVREMRYPALRTTAHHVLAICEHIEPGHLPREQLRELIRLARELERAACLIDALTTRVSVIQMDASLRALRDFITADLRQPEQAEAMDLVEVTRDVIGELAEFAQASNVAVELQGDVELPTVLGDRRDLSRAVANLLHNAIKYSWHRERSKSPWVAVRFEVDGNIVAVEFETWGVPVTTEEIDQGLIFGIGYRGKWSTDRGRLGTGIGLTDALRVAREHGGSVHLNSRPAQSFSHETDHPEYYRQPFLTTARLTVNAEGRRNT